MRPLNLALALSLLAGQVFAQGPAVPGFGAFTAPAGVHEPASPTRTYKVVFEVTKGASDPKSPAAGLDRVARFVNILADSGVPASQRKLVAVIHGPATEAVLNDESYARRHGGAKNPNRALIQALQAAGVEVHVCSHALTNQKIPAADVIPNVQQDLAAMLTIAHLQLDGYALVIG